MATDRIPPGQEETKDFPVLHYGAVPEIEVQDWRFKIFGLVKKPWETDFKGFMKLPQTVLSNDIHCVTGWSKLDNTWEGVPAAAVLEQVEIKPEASHVMVHAKGGWTTNIPLEEFMSPEVIFAYKHNGRELSPEHGWPLRLVVPKLYFWKSAKWVTGIEFMPEDKPGFWEKAGYHMHGDPWKEERYN